MQKRNDWFFWSKNKHSHFIVWRNREDSVATANIKETPDGVFTWKVDGWSHYEATGTSKMLDEAKQAASDKVFEVIKKECKPEYVHPLG